MSLFNIERIMLRTLYTYDLKSFKTNFIKTYFQHVNRKQMMFYLWLEVMKFNQHWLWLWSFSQENIYSERCCIVKLVVEIWRSECFPAAFPIRFFQYFFSMLWKLLRLLWIHNSCFAPRMQNAIEFEINIKKNIHSSWSTQLTYTWLDFVHRMHQSDNFTA